MRSSGETIDDEVAFQLAPGFLDEIVQQLQDAKTRGWSERRKSARKSFGASQLLAPFYKRMPTFEMFRPVKCYDISTTGIAFYWPETPDFRKAIIGLGVAPRLTFLGMQVIRHSPVEGQSPAVIVGCEFIDRVTIRS